MAYVDPFAPSFGTNLVVTPVVTSASSAVSPHDACNAMRHWESLAMI